MPKQMRLFDLEDAKLREGQHCYEHDGKMCCNFIVRWGRRIKPKVKEVLCFPARRRSKKRRTKGNKRLPPLVTSNKLS